MTTEPAAPQDRTYRWVALAGATIAQTSASFLVQGLGALAGYMQRALDLSAFEIGLLVSAAHFVPIIGLLVAGELLDRFSERLIVGVGALIVAAGLAGASFAASYQSLLIWLLIVGVGYSTAQPGGSKAVSSWFSTSQRGFAMGIRQAGLPLGGALAAATLPSIAAAHGWPAAFAVGAGVACFGGVLFMAIYRSPAASPSASASASAISLRSALAARLALFRDPGMRNIMWSGVALVTVQYGILVFIVLDLRDRFGLSLAAGASLLFVAQCAGVVGRVVLASWSDRCKAGRFFPVMTSIWALLAGLIVLLLSSNAPPAYLVILAAWLGFFGFGWYGPWVAYVTESAPPARVGFALGLAMAINQIAIIASPPALGLLRDTTGSYLGNWVTLIVILLVAAAMTRNRSRSR